MKMKRKICILGLISLTAFTFQSCFFSEEDIFDASSEERSAQAMADYKAILSGAPNGWLMEYYPGGEEHDMGGIVLLMKFDGENVTIASDTQVKGYTESTSVLPGERITSKYTVKADQGPVLSFSTYNALIHYWTEPKGGMLSDGYKGDFEFIITEAHEDELSLRGKLYGTEVRMRRLSDDQDWDSYITSCADIRTACEDWGTLVGYNGGQVFSPSAFSQEKVLRFEEGTGENAITKTASFTYTPDGIRLYSPTIVSGVSMESFSWDNVNKTFVCKENGNVQLKYVQPADYVPLEFYTQHEWDITYDINFGQRDTTETITFSRIGDSDTLQTSLTALGLKLPIKAWYNKTTGMLEFRMQYVGFLTLSIIDEASPSGLKSLDTYVYLSPFNDEDMTMYFGERSGIVGYTTQMKPRVFKFKDNGRSSGFEATGFLLYAFEQEDRSGMLGSLESYTNISMKIKE